MSNKADFTQTKITAGETEPWPVLKRLRYGLQQLNKPWPASVRGLFQQELRLLQLEACPSALSLQTLDNSPTLQNAVDAATFSEQELIEAFESQVRRRASGGNPDTQAGAINSETPSRVSSTRSQSPFIGSAARSERYATDNATDKKVPAESSGFGNALVDSSRDLSLAPEFMQTWIDEILAQSPQPEARQSERDSRADLQAGRDPSPYSIKQETESRGINSQKGRRTNNERTSQVSGQRESHPAKVSYLSGKTPKANVPDVSQPKPSHSFFQPVFKAGGKHTGASGDAVSATPSLQKVPQGMVLLKQLVAWSDNSATHAAQTHPSRFSQSSANNDQENRKPLARKDPHDPFSGNSNSASPFGVPATQISTQPRNPDALFNSLEKPLAGSQQEPDRLAELVNEALIEQALRNGVDLS